MYNLDSAVIGSGRIGYFRIGVRNPLFDEVRTQFEQDGASADITRRKLILSGARDDETGWRNISYSESTIHGLMFSKGASFSIQNVGFYAREDRMCLTADPVNIYDQLVGADGHRFEVKTKRKHPLLDSFSHYELQCSEAVLYQESPGATAWSLTRPRDPRYRTKLFLDTYLRPAQITMNNDETPASFAVLFADPSYPLELEFRGASNRHGLYAIGLPTETALMDPVSETAYAYKAEVPITVSATDSTGVSGTSLWWKMVAELKYVIENYPRGSLRSPSPMRPRLVHLGSTPLWQSVFTLNYRRDKDT